MSASTSSPPIRDSDQRILAAAQAALAACGYRAVAALKCQVTAGEVRLVGTVTSYYLKQLAQQAVLQIPLVQRVDNRIQVQPVAPEQGSRSCQP